MHAGMATVLIDELKQIVGHKGWIDDPQALEPHLTEWRGSYRGRTALLVKPDSTEKVSAIMRACSDARVPVVVQGGNTGLCGGAIPDSSGQQVLLSLARMNRVRALSPEDFSMVAEAGCVLSDLRAAAAGVDRLFPLSLAAEGSCQIGGNLSTNAGGINVLRYGTARNQALGLEVVLASGEIWDGLRTLRKDTAGYDVKQLFIGAEGTLGVITAASLKLYPALPDRDVALLAVPDPQAAVSLFAFLRERLADQMQAFELLSARALRFVLRHVPGAQSPFNETFPWYVLLDTVPPAGADSLLSLLESLLERELILDAALAKNGKEQDDLWQLRHSVSAVQKREGGSLKHDVSVPVGEVGRFIVAAESAVLRTVPGCRIVAFGHVGDGNVHFNVSQPQAMQEEAFLALRDRVASVVYDVVADFDGSISAEHGVGRLKVESLRHYRGKTELEIMRTVKRALDPNNLLNPGKVL